MTLKRGNFTVDILSEIPNILLKKFDEVLKNVVQITASLKKGSSPFEFGFRSDTSDKILY